MRDAWLYGFFRTLFGSILHIFYRRVHVQGEVYASTKGPIIIISNHWNTFNDILLTGWFFPRVMYFFANASLFRWPLIGPLLKILFTLPVERPQDTGGKRINNTDNFQHAIRHLLRGGCLYVAPEGVSVRAWHIQKLKTGTARIALEAARQLPEGQQLHILPVGIVYEAPATCNKEACICFAPPILVPRPKATTVDWGEVEALTEQMSNALRSVTVHVPMEEQSEFQIEQSQIRQSLHLPFPEHVKALQQWVHDRKIKQLSLRQFILKYQSHLQENSCTDTDLRMNASWLEIFLYSCVALLCLPFWLGCWLVHGCPQWIVGYFTRKFIPYKVYYGTVKLTVGVMIQLLWYFVFYHMTRKISSNLQLESVSYCFLLLPGLFLWFWLEEKRQQWWKLMRSKIVQSQRPGSFRDMNISRKSIDAQLSHWHATSHLPHHLG